MNNQYSTTLRRAIIKVNPDYYAWSIEKQEQYGVTLSDEDRFRLDQSILKSLFGVIVTEHNEMKTFFDELDDQKYLVYNSTILPLTGIGENKFFMNEYFADDDNLLNYQTLYDYDYSDHNFQESARLEENRDYKKRQYIIGLNYLWCRLIIENKFYYGTLCSVPYYLMDQINDLGFDKIHEFMPHKYVSTKEHGKRTNQGFIYSMRLDANGLERQVEELTDRLYKFMHRKFETWQNECSMENPAAYLIDTSTEDDPFKVFIFNNSQAIRSIHFKSFMQDCSKILGDTKNLDEKIKRERDELFLFLKEQYDDVMNNFDPTVIRMRKKMKILVHEQASDFFFNRDD